MSAVSVDIMFFVDYEQKSIIIKLGIVKLKVTSKSNYSNFLTIIVGRLVLGSYTQYTDKTWVKGNR